MVPRRTILSLAGTFPFVAAAQPAARAWYIGVLLPIERAASAKSTAVRALIDGLRDAGYVEGRNVRFEWRYAEFDYARLRRLAEELVRLRVDLIITYGSPGARAAHAATKTIPIVTASAGDPVVSGFADSLAKPGRNVTGMSIMAGAIDAKRHELLTSVLPKSVPVAYLANPDNRIGRTAEPQLQAAVLRFGAPLLVARARRVSELEPSLAAVVKRGAGALMVADESLFNGHTAIIAEAALRHRLPSCFPVAGGARDGGLMSYGIDYAGTFRQVGRFVDRVLKGAKPGDLPFEQPTRFELVVNVKTAATLGLQVPKSLLLRADRTIA